MIPSSAARAGVANDECLVVVAQEPGLSGYTSDNPEFSPSEHYPEYNGRLSETRNPVYSLLRRLLAEGGLDAARQDRPDWNPLGDIIQPGQRVLVKPNFVSHDSRRASLDSLVTHGSLIRAVLDYVMLAKPSRVVVADAPLLGCDFGRLMQATGLERVASLYAKEGWPVEWLDLRCMSLRKSQGRFRLPVALSGVRDTVEFDLKHESLLDPVTSASTRFNNDVYAPGAHRPGVHRYSIAAEVIESDVVLSLPKLKTHKKAGLTGALKNAVGTCGRKDFLPHYRKGGSECGGDCYRGTSWLKDLADRLLDYGTRGTGLRALLADYGVGRCVRLSQLAGDDSSWDGNWHGNDTVWRMALDLNRVIMYGRPDGTLSNVTQRRLAYITDAIVAGEGDGPLAPTPKALGLVSLGLNPAAVDYVHAYLMGLDWKRLPIVREAFGRFTHPLVDFTPEQVKLRMDGTDLKQPWSTEMTARFLPASSWRGECELDR